MKGAELMLQHFSFKPMYENKQLPGWTFSFFYKQVRYSGEYLPDGSITWTSTSAGFRLPWIFIWRYQSSNQGIFLVVRLLLALFTTGITK